MIRPNAWRPLASLVVALLVFPAAVATHATKEECFTERQGFSELCPDPDPGAACVSHGLIVIERDATSLVGDLLIDLADSRAWTDFDNGLLPYPPTPLSRPPDPQAVASATSAGGAYSNFLLSVSAQAVFSHCEVEARYESKFGPSAGHAYGRAGAAEASINILGIQVDAEALDFELNAWGSSAWPAEAAMACDIEEVSVNILADPVTAVCAPPNTSVVIPVPPVGIVTITVNEETGPFLLPTGQWLYAGAALHVNVLTFTGQEVDIYVGYVAVAVPGAGATPPVWIPNTCPMFGPPLCD